LLLSLPVCISGRISSPPGRLLPKKTVVIPRGAGFRGTSELLVTEGVIAHALPFEAVAVITGKARQFKAGEYLFPAGITPADAMEMIAAGKVVVHKLTVPEGLAHAGNIGNAL
jgi:UPF0755 protein